MSLILESDYLWQTKLSPSQYFKHLLQGIITFIVVSKNVSLKRENAEMLLFVRCKDSACIVHSTEYLPCFIMCTNCPALLCIRKKRDG